MISPGLSRLRRRRGTMFEAILGVILLMAIITSLTLSWLDSVSLRTRSRWVDAEATAILDFTEKAWAYADLVVPAGQTAAPIAVDQAALLAAGIVPPAYPSLTPMGRQALGFIERSASSTTVRTRLITAAVGNTSRSIRSRSDVNSEEVLARLVDRRVNARPLGITAPHIRIIASGWLPAEAATVEDRLRSSQIALPSLSAIPGPKNVLVLEQVRTP